MSAPPFRKHHRLRQEVAAHRRIKPRVAVTTDGDEQAKALREAPEHNPDQDERTGVPADSAVPNITVTKLAVDFGSPDRDGIGRDC